MSNAIGLRRGLMDGAAIPRRRAHIRGDIRSEATELANADVEGPPDVVALTTSITDDEFDALQRERKRYLRGKRGRPPKQVAEFVMWGPPRHAAENAWPRERSVEWAEASLAWVKKHFPDSPITDSSLHLDEGSPHIHVALYPRYKDAAGETAYGWQRAEKAASERLAGAEPLLNSERQGARGREAAGAAMRLLLDSYHAEVGEKFGLTRGVRGSGRRHQAVTVDEASRRHAKDREAKSKKIAKGQLIREGELNEREAQLDTREEKLAKRVEKARAELTETRDQMRDEIAAERAQVKAARSKLFEERLAAKSDFDKRADLLLESQEALKAWEKKLDAKAAALKQLEQQLTIERKTNAEELRDLRKYKRQAAPFVKEGLARRNARQAQIDADKAYDAEVAKDLQQQADLADAHEQERREEAEAERKRKRGNVFPVFKPNPRRPRGGDRER